MYDPRYENFPGVYSILIYAKKDMIWINIVLFKKNGCFATTPNLAKKVMTFENGC